MHKVVAKVLVINKDDKLLFLYRGNTHPNFPGHLDLPGGEVEEGEAWELAVSRELKEETSIKTTPNIIKKVFTKPYAKVTHVLYELQLSGVPPDIYLSWEHSNYVWLSKNEVLELELPKNPDPYYLDVINYLGTTI